MDLLIDCALRNIFITRKDLFDEKCIFLKFEMDHEDYDWSTGFQSSSRFGRIVFRRDENVHHSAHLVLKVTPPRLFFKAFSILQFANEIYFYTRILPFFENHRPISHLFPQYYNSLLQYNVTTDEAVIVFENIQALGYVSPPKKSYLDYDHLALMLRKLGEFHAYSYCAKQRDSDQFYALISGMLETNPIILKQHQGLGFETYKRGFIPLLNDSRYNYHSEKLKKIFADELDKLSKYTLTGDKQNHTHVLCHGDFLRNNVLFKYENEKPVDLKLVDMATWRFASPVFDLSSVLYLNADQRMREENWDKLIDEYYTALQNTFPSSKLKVPTKDSILEEFKRRAMFAYMIASYFLPVLIADDNKIRVEGQTDIFDFVEYKNGAWKNDSPAFDFVAKSCSTMGGKEATIGLTNILRDIIDRNFL